MKHGLLHGKNGHFKWTDGTSYKGEFQNNEITGVGKYNWPDGSIYEGEVKNGLRHGKGRYVNPKEGVEYEGQWLDGMRHGPGTLTYKNGSVYEGLWERGMKWGLGKMTYASSNFYEGEWKNNKRNGKGTMYWLTSDEKYEGNWEDNFQSGFGAHIWLDSNSENKLLRNRYVGYWKLGQRNGQGTFYYSNGSKYEGQWRDNLKHGHGLFTFDDGTIYEGPFDNDRMLDRPIPQKEAANLASAQAELAKEKKDKEKEKKANKDGKKPPGKEPAKSEANKTQNSTSSKFPAQRRRVEVEENPYKKMIDVSDLMELEDKPEEVLKEVQNILLRHNSELKSWYRDYSRKFEAGKSEESFAMELRQVWRFLRDCHVVSASSTLAQFNRLYNQGVRNHFELFGVNDKEKFDFIYKVGLTPEVEEPVEEVKAAPEEVKPVKKKGSVPPNIGAATVGGLEDQHESIHDVSDHQSAPREKEESKVEEPPKVVAKDLSDDEDEDEPEESKETAQIPTDDNHQANKLVLRRQFFEAVARAASVKYAAGSSLPHLAAKLEELFTANLVPLACKNRSKTVDQVKEWRAAEKVYDEEKYSSQLSNIYRYFSKKQGGVFGGRKDETIAIEEVFELLTKAKLLKGMDAPAEEEEDPAQIDTKQLIFLIERFYDPADTLKSKLAEENFEAYLEANPMLLRANREAEAKRLKEEEERAAAEARAKAKLEAGEEEGEEQVEEPPEEAAAEEGEGAADENADAG
jgi:hypothetical protein